MAIKTIEPLVNEYRVHDWSQGDFSDTWHHDATEAAMAISAECRGKGAHLAFEKCKDKKNCKAKHRNVCKLHGRKWYP